MIKCWIITEGMIGTQNQCVALAEAAGLTSEIKIVKLKQPWKTVTPWISHFSKQALAEGSSEFNAPWPDIIIASGRKAIAPALWIKKQSGYKTKLVIIQSPIIKNKQFDLVIAPLHDRYTGQNVLNINGALSVINSTVLETAKAEWAPTLGTLPSPRVAVLIGGTSRTHKITPTIIDHLAERLRALLEQDYSLMVTASRRTPAEYQQTLRDALMHPNARFFDGTGENPYRGYLAWADIILVTEDSVSMACEAISTGKPVYIVNLEGGSDRFNRFHNNLEKLGYTRRFEGILEKWSYEPPKDLQIAAEMVKNLLLH